MLVSGRDVPGVVLSPPLFDTEGKWRDGSGLGGASAGGFPHARLWHAGAAWAGVVAAVGADPGAAPRRGQGLRDVAGLHAAVPALLAGELPLELR